MRPAFDPRTGPENSPAPSSAPGRMGTVLAAALDAPAIRRGEPIPDDAEVAPARRPGRRRSQAVAAAMPAGPLLGHCSGATGLDVFDGREGFSLHPMMSMPTGSGRRASCAARAAAVDGTSDRALDVAFALAAVLGHRRDARRRRGPRRLPRGRRDRRELPRRPGSLRRAAGGDGGHHPSSNSRRSCSPPRASGREIGPEAALTGADRARRRGHGRAPSRRDRPAHARAPAGLGRAGRGDPRRGG